MAALKVLLGIAAVAIPAAFLSGIGVEETASRPAATATYTIQRGRFARTLLVTGELTPVRAVRITVPRFRDRASVPIQAMAPEGSLVRPGDLLLQIDNANLMASLATEQINLEKASNDLAKRQSEEEIRLKELERVMAQRRMERDKAAVKAEIPKEFLALWEWQNNQFAKSKTEEEFRQATLALDGGRKSATGELAALEVRRDMIQRKIAAVQEDLRAMQITADREGTVLYENAPLTWNSNEPQRKFQPGDQVWPGMTILSVPDLSEMEVRIFISEVDGGKVRPGQTVHLTLDSSPDRVFTGIVDFVPEVAEQLRRLSNVRVFIGRVKLAETDRSLMRPGLSVRAQVELEEQTGLTVPRQMAVERGGRYYVARANGQVTEIKLLERNETTLLIAGLSEGEKVVLSGEAR